MNHLPSANQTTRTLSDGRDAVSATVNVGARLELERLARQARPIDPVTLVWRRQDALEARCEAMEAALFQLAAERAEAAV